MLIDLFLRAHARCGSRRKRIPNPNENERSFRFDMNARSEGRCTPRSEATQPGSQCATAGISVTWAPVRLWSLRPDQFQECPRRLREIPA